MKSHGIVRGAYLGVPLLSLLLLLGGSDGNRRVAVATRAAATAPVPLLKEGHAVDWWFVFKFNTHAFPGCGTGAVRQCLFGGSVQPYPHGFGQQFAFASSEDQTLQKGSDCAGGTTADPLGATFDEVYNGAFHYVIWNDQFYDDPKMACGPQCGAPWGHSKGMLAWNDDGEGLVLQVTTPSWPASGSAHHPRKTDGNTLGCVHDDNVEVSQDFFSLKLSAEDVAKVLAALQHASVLTDVTNPQVVSNGGPEDIQKLVEKLGTRSTSKVVTTDTLSTGVVLISKPSRLHVPPWQMISALLGGVSLRAATWWAAPTIHTTDASTEIKCWDESLLKPGAVEIAATGQFDGKEFGLLGGVAPDFNHAKIGVSTSGDTPFTIFGDMNQQGTLSGANCASSQNGRGGLFYVLKDSALFNGVTSLIAGSTAK